MLFKRAMYSLRIARTGQSNVIALGPKAKETRVVPNLPKQDGGEVAVID